MKRMSPKSQSDSRYKVKKVMDEWEGGTLKSSSGQPVTNQKQAIAIALSEQRRYNSGKRKRSRRK